MSLFRIYIDEVGNHDLSPQNLQNERFLSLTGVIIESGHCKNHFIPSMEEMKRQFFVRDPDEPIILHRKEILNKRNPFQALRDPIIEQKFNQTLLTRLTEWEYRVITIVIDKKTHLETYSVWRYQPYHYCLSVLLERYVLFLHYGNHTGDVMVEGRGKEENQNLEKSYERLYEKGTDKIPLEIWQQCITSGKLKIKVKTANICGLQLADLLAHPSRREVLLDHELIEDNRDTFGDKITEILNADKYHRHYKNGKIEGYGKKLLP